MNAAGASRAGCSRHANQWIIIDTRFQLLSIGAALYRGSSPRTALDITARRILLPRIRQASLDGVERTQTALDAGCSWTVRVVPIKGPVSGAPLAVLGCYGHEASRLPPEPLVGAWEWRVTPPGPRQQMRTYWSESLYKVYAIPPPSTPGLSGPEWNYWEGPEWLDRLIVDSDRVEIRRMLDEFIAATTDALFIHSYRVRSPATGEVHRLRLAGRSYVADAGPVKWFRGISMRIDDVAPDANLSPSPMTYLDAAFAIAGDPLCAIDTVYEHIYLTSQTFGELGIELPSHRHLPQMVHPDDMDTLRHWLKQTVASPTTPVGPVEARLAAHGGGWKILLLVGTAVSMSDGEPHHVLCRVTVAGTDSQGMGRQ